MAKTIVGIFDEAAKAQSAQQELQGSGINPAHIRLVSNDAGQNKGDDSWKDKIVAYLWTLFEHEGDRQHADHYAEAWRRGQFLVVADVENTQVDRTVEIMKRYGTIDLDRRAEQWKSTGYQGRYDHSAAPYTPEERARELSTLKQQQTQAVPVVQEELAVGKQVVQRGGVRIHSYVQERPVEEIVRLREERVNVARRPVDRPVTPSDQAFQERTIEVTAQGEQAVVEKRARVVEEVVVGKDVQQREETVHGNVRRKDVRVEEVGDVAAKTASVNASNPAASPRR